jgi:hypothetical protein
MIKFVIPSIPFHSLSRTTNLAQPLTTIITLRQYIKNYFGQFAALEMAELFTIITLNVGIVILYCGLSTQAHKVLLLFVCYLNVIML